MRTTSRTCQIQIDANVNSRTSLSSTSLSSSSLHFVFIVSNSTLVWMQQTITMDSFEHGIDWIIPLPPTLVSSHYRSFFFCRNRKMKEITLLTVTLILFCESISVCRIFFALLCVVSVCVRNVWCVCVCVYHFAITSKPFYHYVNKRHFKLMTYLSKHPLNNGKKSWHFGHF